MDHAQYRSLLTRAYDVDKPDAPPEELTFYRELIAHSGEPALEVMCGSGRFLVPLLADGFDVDGVDASEDMLAACMRRGGDAVQGRLHRQRVQELGLSRRYALIFCGGGSFGLLVDDEHVSDALARCHAQLRPGGVLSLEVETPHARPRLRSGSWAGRWWHCPDGDVIVLRHLQGPVDETTEQALGIYELYRDGVLVQTELNEWVRRFWTHDEIRGAMTGAGFVDVAITAAFGTGEPDADAEMLTVTARRPST